MTFKHVTRYWSVCIFVCIIAIVCDAGPAPLYKFNATEVATRGARCLDGTPSGYYLYKTSNAAYKNHWAIFMEGGGWCFANTTWPNVEGCAGRAKTTLGSSNGHAATMNIGFIRDYNYVYIFYCGGDFHSGQRTAPVGGLYYAGHLTVKAAVTRLKEVDTINSATQIIVTGESAGGLGTFVNFDYIKSQFPNADVKAWSNAGWFPEDFPPHPSNYISLVASFKILYSQVDAYLNQACLSHHTADPWLCYSGHNVYPYANVPLFMAQSVFDDWAKGFLGVPNDFTAPATKAYWAPYGKAMRDTFQAALAGPITTGLFLSTNDEHLVPQGEVIQSHTLNEMLNNWIDGKSPDKVQSTCDYVNCLPL